MKVQSVFLTVLLLLSVHSFAQINQIVGRWKTIDDSDGTTKSIVLIYQDVQGKYAGKVEKLFKDPSKLCTACEGENKNKPIVGMLVIQNMEEKKGKLTGGTILDPSSGKVYRCNISYDEKKGQLRVKGSLDKSGLIGRTQIWVKE